jgi:hypothetical protein
MNCFSKSRNLLKLATFLIGLSPLPAEPDRTKVAGSRSGDLLFVTAREHSLGHSTTRPAIVYPVLLDEVVAVAKSYVCSRTVSSQVSWAERRIAQSVLTLVSVFQTVAIVPAVAARIRHLGIKRTGKVGD